MILIIRKHELYKFSKYEFATCAPNIVEAIERFLIQHGYKRQEYEFTYKGINFKGKRLSDRMDTEIHEV